MEKQELYKSIYKEILSSTRNAQDYDLIYLKDVASVGKYFVSKIMNKVKNNKLENIEEVFNIVRGVENTYKTEEEFYIEFGKYLGYNYSPRSIYRKVLEEYIRVDREFHKILDEITLKINELKNNKECVKKRKKKLINKCNLEKKFLKDLKKYESDLMVLSQECRDFETEIEIVVFLRDNLIEMSKEMPSKENKQAVINWARDLTLRILNEKETDVESYFKYYYEIIDCTKSDYDNYYKLFFKIKLWKFYDNRCRDLYKRLSLNPKINIEDESKRIREEIPSIEVLNNLRNSNMFEYKKQIKDLIKSNNVINEINNSIKRSYCLRNRKNILERSLELFENNEFEVFNNIISIQIEGIFNDFLLDVSTINRFSNLNLYQNDVLRKKIEHLQKINSGIYTEAVGYFKYYFNNRIRNLIAHGNYDNMCRNYIDHECISLELILDLNYVIGMIEIKSESENMFRFINNYKKVFRNISNNKSSNNHFGALFNDLNGTRVHCTYDSLQYIRPIQIVYWLVNPYYEDIYNYLGNKLELLELRNDLLGKEFWGYVDEKLDKYKENQNIIGKINEDFYLIVRGLFSCTKDAGVKTILQSVNSKLKEIQDL